MVIPKRTAKATAIAVIRTVMVATVIGLNTTTTATIAETTDTTTDIGTTISMAEVPISLVVIPFSIRLLVCLFPTQTKTTVSVYRRPGIIDPATVTMARRTLITSITRGPIVLTPTSIPATTLRDSMSRYLPSTELRPSS